MATASIAASVVVADPEGHLDAKKPSTSLHGELTHDNWGTALMCCGNTGHNNPIQDVQLGSKICSAPKASKVKVGSECWEHVHDDEQSVYDFTRYVRTHADAEFARRERRSNTVADMATDGALAFSWPGGNAGHWETTKSYARNRINFLGRRGDMVDFVDLHRSVRVEAMAQLVGSESTHDGSHEACGSPGEVANVPAFGNQFQGREGDGERNGPLDVPTDSDLKRTSMSATKAQVWENIAIKGADQLRQRVAWALSQILVIGESGLQNEAASAEMWTTFYDIFVRNAFGNYRDVLKEVSYSVPMGQYLTFLYSKSMEAMCIQPRNPVCTTKRCCHCVHCPREAIQSPEQIHPRSLMQQLK